MPKGKGKSSGSADVSQDNSNKILSLADVVKAKGSLEQIETLFAQGIAIDTEELSIDDLKAYVKPLAKKKLHHKLLNTIDLYQNMTNQRSIKELIAKPHYHTVLNKKGHNLAHALVTLGFEEECITLLKHYQEQRINYTQESQSIWHLAVRYNCETVIAFLTLTQPENIDCLDSKSLTPWSLSVLFNNIRISRLLREKGANTNVFVNEEGQTLLHVAVNEEDDDLLEKCFNCNVPSNIIDTHGYTPQHYARMKGDTALCDKLARFQWSNYALLIDYFNSVQKGDVVALKKVLESNFNRNTRNGRGYTALDIARIHKHSAIVELLKTIGVEPSLTQNEIKKLAQQSSKPQLVSSQFKISFKKIHNALVLSVNDLGISGKSKELLSIDPWSKNPKALKDGRWKYMVKESLCYLILMDEVQGTQPSLICILSKTGDCHVTFSNLPNTSLSFETSANFKLDGLVSVNQLLISARSITSTKPFKMLNGSMLKLNAKNIELNGEMTAKEANISAEATYQQSAELRAEKVAVNANAVTISGQVLASKQFEFEAKNKLVLTGHLATGHQGSIKANSVLLERSSSVVSQHGSIAIRSSANINNLGSIIGNHITLDSALMITNHMGAMIKGLHCTLHAPQVNQAGFLLSGLKPTLSYVDLSLSALHAATNVAEYFSAIPTPQAIALRGYLLLSKTLHRGGDLLYKAINGDEIDNKSVITLVLDNVLPSIGFLSSSDEKATLLLNVLYQFYGAYSSDDKFIYKSLEFIEALTRTITVVSGGLLSDENLEWLQLATKMLNGSRHALKLAEVGASAIRAWHSDDQIELDRAQEKFKTITEMAFREALYKLEPSQLLGSSLGSTPVDIVHYIINQGYSSEFYLQSIIYGTLHAAKRTGMIQADLESDLLFSAKLLFRMKHWQELYKQYQKDELNAHAVVNEVLNSLMVVLSSERVRSAIDEDAKSAPPQNTTVDAEAVVIEASNEPVLTEVVVAAEVAEVADIPEKMTTEDLQKVVTTANEDAVQVIPEFPKQSVLLDIEKVAESALAQKPTQANESRSVTLLKSLVEVQKGLNGDYAAQGYFGAFVSALHNEGIIEVTGNIGLNIQSATNNGLVKATQSVGVYGKETHNRTDDNKTRSQLLAESINSNFVNLESGIIDAGQALYLTCIGILENFGELKSLGRIVTTANRIVRNHQSGKIIAKKDVTLLCDLLAENEGLIIGESVHLEGTLEKAENKGTIIGVDKIRLISSKLSSSAKGSKLVAKKVDLNGPKIVKEGMIQAEVVTTTGQDQQIPESVTWRKDEGDAIGVVVLTASEGLETDKDAFNNVQIVDVTLPQLPIDSGKPLFDISSDFSHTLQLHLPKSDQMIPIWQLPKMSSDATFILDAPGAHLHAGSSTATFDSTFRFSGNSFNYSNSQIAFSQPAFFDVSQIEGVGATSELLLGKGGLLQADAMRNTGHVQSGGILDWNVDLLQNNAELAESTEYFYYSKHNPLLQAHTKTSVIPNSGTIEALGHRGFVGDFSQVGGTFASGTEETYVYYTKSSQEAILTKHGENPTGVLHDAGQNWYSKPEWHNSQITSKGRCVLVGEQDFRAAGLTLWGDKGSYIHAPKGIYEGVLSQSYEIDQILSLTRHGKVNGVAHERESGSVITQNAISSNSGGIVLTAPEGSIHLNNVVLSSAGDATLIARDEVSINGIAAEKHSSYAYENKGLFGTKRVQSATDEKLVYSSFIFTGGELIVRCNEFTLDTVQGAIGGNADIVALKTTLKGQQQTYHNNTSIKEFSIGVPGQDLLSIIKGHNAKAVFASIMNHSGWDQSQLDSLLNAKSVAEIPQPLLHTAQNAWNVTALVAHACAELGESPADFVGTFTDKMGLTVVGENKIRQFNPSFTINSSSKKQETHSTKTISTNLLVGGTFRLLGNELHVFDGSTVDAEDLRVFVIEGIKATKGLDTYKSTSQNKHHHLGVSLLNPNDVSARSAKATEVEEQTQTKLATLSARNTAQVNGGALIQGDLKISANKGGIVTAKVMDFTTSQNTRVLRSHNKQANVSTGGAVGGSYKAHTIDDATTHEKAGVYLRGGQVVANEIHLANGSKIQAAQITREDAQPGLPVVSGTAMQDHYKDNQKAVSLSAAVQGEPSADISRSVKETDIVHRPTVIADNVAADSLPGINTQADKETEVVREKSSGFAVAGFIPDKEKFQRDLTAITGLRDKGLHWLYGKDNNTASQPAAGLEAAKSIPLEKTTESELVDMKPVESVAVATETVQSAVDGALNQGTPTDFTRGPDGRLNILITRPPSWTTPTEPTPDKHQPQSPIGDTSKFDSFIEHVDAFNHGFEKGRDGLVDAALHPIRTIVDTTTLVWDVGNAATDLTLGLSTEGSRDRNEQRVALLHEAGQSFVEGDSVYRTEMLSELGASLVLGSIAGGVAGGAGGLARRPVRAQPALSKTRATKSKAAPKAQPTTAELEIKEKSFTPQYSLRSSTKVEKGKSVDTKPVSAKPSETKTTKPSRPYAPDRELPDSHGVGIPDPEARGVRHTQLGTQQSERGNYTKAREFDEHGKPFKDIDFTNHRRKDHTDPHQHVWQPNITGGTAKRGKAEPLVNSMEMGAYKADLPPVSKPKL